MTYVALFFVLSLAPGYSLISSTGALCYTNLERGDCAGGEPELPAFSKYMISMCPAPYRPEYPSDLWPNATVGELHWG